MSIIELLHLNNANGYINLFNNLAVFMILAAYLLSKGDRRLVVVILVNYLIAYGISFSLMEYNGRGFDFKISDTAYYLISALREVIILVFLLDAWMQNKARAFWCKSYLTVITVSMFCNVILAYSVSTEVANHIKAGHGGFRTIHYHINQLIPFAEVFIAWGSSNNAISRFFSRWRKPKPETPTPL